ncbi:polysaccharide deacetylase family protein [Meiothermus granaticius]|uniref:Peptidoglycan-N-acetylmuramic acid deacetylase PdaA n=1 Tax=Meiothermus granaticius NBRC 107808 TaxID=1227551 RepID=A0A399FBR7_9DEIN|nr:polysaccharide deacetylase family protein [Meiothermus granaticius]MCL6527957.1 polysaccharide deacetylase family protein [Thermaceae bacterium]RIH92121.1 Peptidoglycan-N-acetylmuramic acid deacetylase PdaA [Meiothermus granaticius NBRC 107808]GEM86264.1 polysaccharide deacetylase familiy protein [Meiothermus granaticius NBRC 107808]
MQRYRLVLTALLWSLSAALAQPQAPLPKVEPILPGEVQPLAPGQLPPPVLPQISLTPAIPEVRRISYASNGFIEVAAALVLVPEEDTNPEYLLSKAQQVARATFAARPSLEEVDLSLYSAKDYAGFGGPLPRFTAAVNKARLPAFLALNLGSLHSYDHLWLNPGDSVYGPPAPYTSELERTPRFQGTGAQVRAQQLEQTAASQQGGVLGNLLYHGDPSRPLAALTFDDAPHPLYTPLLLDALRRARVRATFFCIGRNAKAYPYFIRDLSREGHEIGNHTYHHVRLNNLDAASIRQEIVLANQVLEGITGKPVHFFRPPGGRFSPTVLSVVRELGMTMAFWTDDPADFDNLGDARLENRLVSKLRPGGIVLLHDNVLQTTQVLSSFLSVAERQGIRLDTLGALVRRAAPSVTSAQP